MKFHDAIRSSLTTADFMVHGYLADITPQEMVARPVADANHIAWQLGHLIASERHLVEAGIPGSMPELPEGFAQRHPREGQISDDPADFFSKEEYLTLAKSTRAATLKVLDEQSEADLDKPVSGRAPPFVKTVGDSFATIAPHWTLHAGQWVVFRRALGRPRMF